MKRVLIISYYWPPSGGSGVQRWLKFVKFLPQYGWQPIVYVPENADYPILDPSLEKDVPPEAIILKQPIWEPYNLYKVLTGGKVSDKVKPSFFANPKNLNWKQRLSVWIRGNWFLPDPRVFWVRPSVKYLLEWMRKNPVDVIVSNGPPHSVHLIAEKLKEKTGTPWLADFRDPWTTIFYFDDLMLSPRAKRIHQRLEKNVANHADRILVVSEGMADDFRERLQKEATVIYNGYDEADYDKWLHHPAERKFFIISYIGTLLTHINYPALWRAISELRNESREFADAARIRLVGTVDDAVFDKLHSEGLRSIVEFIPNVPHHEVGRYQREAGMLLILIAKGPNWKGITTGKIFESIAVKRPVLCLGPEDGAAANILRESEGGVTVHPDDLKKIKAAIMEIFRDFAAGNLETGNASTEKYSRRGLTKTLAALLDSLVKK